MGVVVVVVVVAVEGAVVGVVVVEAVVVEVVGSMGSVITGRETNRSEHGKSIDRLTEKALGGWGLWKNRSGVVVEAVVVEVVGRMGRVIAGR